MNTAAERQRRGGQKQTDGGKSVWVFTSSCSGLCNLISSLSSAIARLNHALFEENAFFKNKALILVRCGMVSHNKTTKNCT